MSSTELLAIIGAIGSAVAITWNFIRTIQDRARLKVTAMVGRIIPHNADQDYLIITIINIGRRPVIVTGWGGMMKKSVKGKRLFKIIPHVPFSVLKEGEYRDEYTDDLSFLTKDLKKICVWDSIGKEWKISRKNLKRLFEEAKNVKSADKE